MKLIIGLQDFGIWLKKDKYHLTNTHLADVVIKRGYAKEIMVVSQDDLSTMLADWKINGVPKEIVKYFKEKVKQ